MIWYKTCVSSAIVLVCTNKLLVITVINRYQWTVQVQSYCNDARMENVITDKSAGWLR